VFYILIAASMIVLILMQRGAGADAGSGFGSGASATVFGARGSASFLTRATAILAALFFLLSLGMGIYLKNFGAPHSVSGSDLGVMAAGLGSKPAATQNAQPTAPASPDVPQATKPAATPDVPAASNSKADVPAPAKSAK
jgi:preprotein translocase subunit SecG